jgi:hypothetical protein
MSPGADLRILLKTVRLALTASGVPVDTKEVEDALDQGRRTHE